MYCYLITVLCLHSQDDYTDTYTEELKAIAAFCELSDQQPEEVVQVMMTTLNTDAVQATINRVWRRP